MPRFAIAVTDIDWFQTLRSGFHLSMVNFWTPTPWGLRKLQTGDRVYFLLKAPIRKIGGYGEFARYSDMTAHAAWDAYGLKNGVGSRSDLVRKIQGFAKKRSRVFHPTDNPVIGCIELTDPVFWDDSRFVDLQKVGYSFPSTVVKIKYFMEADRISIGAHEVEPSNPFALVTGNPRRVAASRKERKGAWKFRSDIFKQYGHCCCITGENIDELLHAAHIQPYIDERSDHFQNGLCLRVDVHHLFDAGLIAISERGTVQISERLRGTSYEWLHDRQLRLPAAKDRAPSSAALQSHRTEVFR